MRITAASPGSAAAPDKSSPPAENIGTAREIRSLSSLSAGVSQPRGHQAQKQEPGAKHNASQSQQLLRDVLVRSPERQEEARPGGPVPRRSQGKDQGAETSGLGEGRGRRAQ